MAGIAVNSAGHCNKKVVEAIMEQCQQMMHASNYCYTIPMVMLAQRICDAIGMEKIYFQNSGAEANEVMIKLARKYGKDNFGPNRYHIVTAKNSFHGRTLATLAATGQPGTAIQRNYDPMIPGFSYAEFNNVQAFADACTDDTIAIMVEPVQGEGGVIPATKEFLQGLRKLCDERNMLLLFDEVQTGWGRTGSLMAYMGYGVKPDCVSMAKAMGGGMPIGAICATAEVANAQIGEIIDQKLPENADKIGAYFREELLKLPCVKEVRGRGLMIGVEFNKDIATDVKYQSADEGLLITAVRPNVIRLVPPLNITEKECDEAFAILHKVVSKLV